MVLYRQPRGHPGWVLAGEGRVDAVLPPRLRLISASPAPPRPAPCSWLYLSRLAALKEYAFMKALGAQGLPVPRAVDSNRHAVLMSMVDAYPLVQVGGKGGGGCSTCRAPVQYHC